MRCRKTPGLIKAIEAAGSMAELARLIGVSKQAVWMWHTVPLNQILAVEKATGIPREELRPDMYRGGQDRSG